MERTLIPLNEGEAVELIRAGFEISAAFGTGGMALIWEEDEPMPPAVEHLLLMRGILNENMDGAGI